WVSLPRPAARSPRPAATATATTATTRRDGNRRISCASMPLERMLCGDRVATRTGRGGASIAVGGGDEGHVRQAPVDRVRRGRRAVVRRSPLGRLADLPDRAAGSG